VFFNLCPSNDAPELIPPSGWKRGEQLVAQVVIVLHLFCLPVTSGVVGVLEGMQFAPGDAFCTTIWRALRLCAVQLPYQVVIQPDRMLSIMHL
jgi:hypothetical protein